MAVPTSRILAGLCILTSIFNRAAVSGGMMGIWFRPAYSSNSLKMPSSRAIVFLMNSSISGYLILSSKNFHLSHGIYSELRRLLAAASISVKSAYSVFSLIIQMSFKCLVIDIDTIRCGKEVQVIGVFRV